MKDPPSEGRAWVLRLSRAHVSASEICVQTVHHELNPLSVSVHANRTERVASIRAALSEFASSPMFSLRKTCAIFRNALAHIGIELATLGERIALGPSLQFQDGCYRQNGYTNACVEGIETLRAIHPWVGNLDVRIYLMGFHAGARYSTAAMESHPNSQDAPRNQ